MAIGPSQPVPSPPLVPAPFGLIATAAVVDHADERFVNGISYDPESCEDAVIWPIVCQSDQTPADDKPDPAARPGWQTYHPFAAIAGDVCSTFGFQAADYQARARRLLAARESKAAEAGLWSAPNLPDDNGRLAAAEDVDVVGGGTVPRRRALAELVQYLADSNGGRGMIHARPLLVELWTADGLIFREQNKLVTGTGILVVAGTGYPGSGPDGEAGEWAFATDPVVVHRGPVFLSPEDFNDAVDKRTNTVVFRAERALAPIFAGCALGAVSVDVATA